MTDFYKILDERKSIRRFKSTPPSDDVIKKIIQKATLGPNAHNSQPWIFIVLKKNSLKENLIKAMGEKYRNDLFKEGKTSEEIDKIISHSFKKFTNPPILIIPCLDKKAMPKFEDEEFKRNEYIMGVQSVSSATTYLILAASAEGLGTCWYCAALFAKKIIQKHLNLDAKVEPQSIIALGYPDENPKKPKRKDLNDIFIQI